MSMPTTPPTTYRNERPYPFCPGCGHGPILDALDAALVRRGVDPTKTVVVSDIGCSGLSDQYFTTSAFHGLHGRSITYATGIKLARPELDVIVVMGDGGTGIGGAHLLAAARRNIGITVIVFNNLNFGMTGGQHSPTTPPDAVTATTPWGNLERPLDIAETVKANGAQYVWRGTSFDDELSGRISDGMASNGFALLDVWELCTAYFVPSNAFSRRAIDGLLGDLGFEVGVLTQRSAPEYAAEYRSRASSQTFEPASPELITPAFRSSLDRRVEVVVAGSAGGRVRSAARIAARAAVDSGLWAAQRDDYPITVKTGHSVSSLIIEPGPVDFPGVGAPDLLVLVATEGLDKVGHLLRAMSPDSLVVAAAGLSVPTTQAKVVTLDPSSAEHRMPKADFALALLVAGLRRAGILDAEPLLSAAGLTDPRFADRTVETVRRGLSLVDS